MKLLKIERAVILGLVISIAASMVSGYSVFSKECDDIRGRVLRLHIIANSDSVSDQQLKLNVRDKILEHSDEIFGKASTKEEAEEKVRAKLDEIEKIAKDEVAREGYSYDVKAQLVNMYFNTRTYGDVTLPAGYYDAVRVTIGKAEGHNWWCVLFPSLCLPAAEVNEGDVLSKALSPNEICIVRSPGNRTIVMKFKTVELFEEFKNFLKSHGIWFFSQKK